MKLFEKENQPHLCLVGCSILVYWMSLLVISRGVWCSLFLSFFILGTNTNLSYASSVDPDQMPRAAASDLGLHCFPMSFYPTLGISG